MGSRYAEPSMRSLLLASCLVAVGAAVGCQADVVGPPDRANVLVVVPADSDPTTDQLLAEVQHYLGDVAATEAEVERLETDDFRSVFLEARRRRSSLVVVLDADQVAADRVPPERMTALGKDGFVLAASDEGDWIGATEDDGATFVLFAGNTPLSRRFGVYEWARRLGVRFYHPEDEYVPQHPLADMRTLAGRPTVLHRDGLDYVPDNRWRSWSFHSAHPLEHMESFSDGDHPIDEARHVNEWVVKNRGNRFRGAGRGVASDEARQRRVDELETLRTEMGFGRGAGITLHNQQQGASAEIDRTSDVPVKEQIESLVTSKLEAVPDAEWFGIHFGPTEFTTTPDRETVDWINWAGAKALELRPNISVELNVHITGNQPVTNFDDRGCPSGTNDVGVSDYYDLAFHTDPRIGANVHTVMFYPLEGAAPVYNQETFAHKLCLMQQASAEGRPLIWFPEASWWLSFDNPIPVYLPLYVWTRWRDTELLAPLLSSKGGGTLDGLRMFNSGHEWGYWQQDYAVGLWAWNADVPLEAVVSEFFDPLCDPAQWEEGCSAKDEASAVFMELMEHQREFFLERPNWEGRAGGLYPYFAGEDQADEIAAATGLEFRPVRIPFDTVAGWGEELLAPFEASDVAALEEAEGAYFGWLERLRALEPSVPTGGARWLAEVIDGVEINALRAAQTRHLYGAAIAYRRAGIAGQADQTAAAQGHWDQAQQALAAAEVVVRRREAAYRYPADQVYGGGVTSGTGVPNGTTYPYRVHTKTHLMTYWHNRNEQVRIILEGGELGETELVTIEEAVAAPGESLSIAWPPDAGASSKVRIGSAGEFGLDDEAVDLGADSGFWPVTGQIVVDGRSSEIVGGIARSDVRNVTPASGVTLIEPSAPLAQSVLSTVFPSLQWAYLDGEAVVLAPDPEEDGVVSYARVVRTPFASFESGSFITEPTLVTIPIALNSGGESVEIDLSQTVLEGAVDEAGIADPLAIEGRISIEDLVVALMEIGGFDEQGSLEALAELLEFDPANPPATTPFSGSLTLRPRE